MLRRTNVKCMCEEAMAAIPGGPANPVPFFLPMQ